MLKNTRYIKGQGGFSLIELMVTLAILAIISGIAAPSMLEIIRDSRLRSMNADFSALLKYSRSEARSKSLPIIVGTIDDGNTWHDNTIVSFIDLNDDGDFDAADTELRRLDISDNFTLTAQDGTPANVSTITFLSSGYILNGQYNFTICDVRPGQESMQHSVLPSGLNFTSVFICP